MGISYSLKFFKTLLASVLTLNLRQKAGDKFMKLSKKGFSMECFTVQFFAIFYQRTSEFGYLLAG